MNCRFLSLGLFALGLASCREATEPAALRPATLASRQMPQTPVSVELGDPALLAGIPGEGPLALADISRFLDDSANHEPLVVELPWHLRDGLPLSIPAENPLTRAKIELGRQLFLDRRLSRTQRFACIDCHPPWRHFSMYLAPDGPTRDPLPAVNRVLSTRQFWDGRAATLEDQPAHPIQDAHELATTPEQCVAQLAAIPGYRVQFERIFGRVDFVSLCQALACFQRALVSRPAAWDWRQEHNRLSERDPASLTEAERARLAEAATELARRPVSPAALRGAELFFSERGGCAGCHRGANFTDESFHRFELRAPQRRTDDGRATFTGDPADRAAFKTPSLRNVAHTAPYFHDGRVASLEEAVDQFTSAELTAQDQADLVEFLKTLSSDPPPLATSRLP